MAKMGNRKVLLFAIAMFAIAAGPSLSGIVFAYDANDAYSHQHITATWDHGLVCGDHKCASGEIPQHPKVIEPVKAH